MGLLGVGNYTNEAMAPTYNKVVIAFYFLFTFVFNLAWGPLAWVCASELSSGRVKNKIMSLGTACFWVSVTLSL